MIHPKTIQPLKAKNISLRIRSFLELDNKGTKISEGVLTEPKVPSYIIKARFGNWDSLNDKSYNIKKLDIS